MSITTQPNEMLDMILNQTGIPLAQRIRLRAVSHHFRATLEDGLQQENSLAIRVVSPSDLKDLKGRNSKVQPNDLLISVSHFTKNKAIALIGRLFPGLTELAINSNSLIAWRKATELLGHFARTLTSLAVDGHLKNLPTRESVFRRLGESINSILTLTSLHLEHENAFDYDCSVFNNDDETSFGHQLLPHLVPTLSHLERFTFAKPLIQSEATLIASSLSSRCTHLRLDLAFHDVTSFPFDEAINLTHLHLHSANDTVLQWVSQLPQLTTLILQDKKMPYLDILLGNLSPLSQVTQATFKGIHCDRTLEPPASKALTFPSIKRLTLQLQYIYGASINFKDYLQTLALWCPNMTTCAIHCSVLYYWGILKIKYDIPYTIKLIDNLEGSF